MAKSVFISSTFSDFQKERKILLETIPYIDIHVNCAERKGRSGKCLADNIEEWIDCSDMVILLIGAKYGSEANSKLSWTRKEFEYAKNTGKEIFAYFRTIPDEYKNYIDKDLSKEKKLNKFIALVENEIDIVPRYKVGEECKLVAMIIRDLERNQKKITEKEENENKDLGLG